MLIPTIECKLSFSHIHAVQFRVAAFQVVMFSTIRFDQCNSSNVKSAQWVQTGFNPLLMYLWAIYLMQIEENNHSCPTR